MGKQFDFGGANGTGAAGSFPHGIALDPSGNIYLAGHFRGNVDFDPGPASYTLKSQTGPGGFFTSDVFVAKLNSAGSFAWAESLGTGGEHGDDGATDIATDAAGNVYVTGAISANGPVDFNPGNRTYKLPGGGAFVSKWDTNRDFIWARRFADGATPFSLAVDSANNVNMTGIFGGTRDFDPGPGTFNLSGEDGSIFVLKLDAAGNFSYAADFGTACGTTWQSMERETFSWSAHFTTPAISTLERGHSPCRARSPIAARSATVTC